MNPAFSKTGSWLLTLWLSLSLSLPIIAQDKKTKPEPKKPAEAETKAESERLLTPTQQQALFLLDSLFDKAKEFNDQQARIRVQGQIADTLWEYDEERARRQFEEAYRAIDDLKVKEEPNFGVFGSSPKSQLRTELLRMISSRDSKLADKLLKTIPNTPSTTSSPFTQIFGTQTEQSSVSMNLALALAPEDPKRAAQMVESSLQGGISPMLIQVLMIIKQKEPEIADRLFLQAVTFAQKDTAQPIMRLLMLAPYAFPNLGGQAASTGVNTLPPNPILIEQFLNLAYNSIMQQLNVAQPSATDTESQQMARAIAPLDYLSVQQILPLFQQYQPEKAALINGRLQQLGGNLSSEQRSQMDNLSSFFNGGNNVSDLVSKADRETNPQQKDMLYLTAASQAMAKGDFDEAISLLDKIKMEEMKSSLGSVIRMQAATKALEKGEVDTAYRYAKDVPDLSLRADVFGNMAQKLVEKRDLARAAEMLDDAEKSLSKANQTPQKASALLSLTAAAAKIDASHGFNILKTAVETINRTDFDPASFGELDMLRSAANGSLMSGMVAFKFDSSFAPLARADYQRALLLAQTIEKKELSVPAQVSVCRGALLKAYNKQAEHKEPPKEQKNDPEKKM